MHAVKHLREQFVCFIADECPSEREGLIVEEGAWIDVAPNISLWPEGARRPEQVLCQSVSDLKHYKLFKYRNEIPQDYCETGLNFGGTFSKVTWEKFDERVRDFASIRGEEDD